MFTPQSPTHKIQLHHRLIGIHSFELHSKQNFADIRSSISETTLLQLYDNYHLEYEGKVVSEFAEIGMVLKNPARLQIIIDPFDERTSHLHREKVLKIFQEPIIYAGLVLGSQNNFNYSRQTRSEQSNEIKSLIDQVCKQSFLSPFRSINRCFDLKQQQKSDFFTRQANDNTLNRQSKVKVMSISQNASALAQNQQNKNFKLNPAWIELSGWNPPTFGRRLSGDFYYLIIRIPRHPQYHITACPKGFFVNESTTHIFKSSAHSGYPLCSSLIDLIRKISFAVDMKFKQLLNPNKHLDLEKIMLAPQYTRSSPPSWLSNSFKSQPIPIWKNDPFERYPRKNQHLALKQWNQHYQAHKNLFNDSKVEKHNKDKIKFKLVQEFIELAREGARILVSEGIQPCFHTPRGLVYHYLSIYFCFLACDDWAPKQTFNPLSQKEASAEIKCISLLNPWLDEDFHLPFYMIVQWGGFKILAQSLPIIMYMSASCSQLKQKTSYYCQVLSFQKQKTQLCRKLCKTFGKSQEQLKNLRLEYLTYLDKRVYLTNLRCFLLESNQSKTYIRPQLLLQPNFRSSKSSYCSIQDRLTICLQKFQSENSKYLADSKAVTKFLHKHGLKGEHLGELYSLATQPYLKSILYRIILVKVFKWAIRQALRKANQIDRNKVLVTLLNNLVGNCQNAAQQTSPSKKNLAVSIDGNNYEDAMIIPELVNSSKKKKDLKKNLNKTTIQNIRETQAQSQNISLKIKHPCSNHNKTSQLLGNTSNKQSNNGSTTQCESPKKKKKKTKQPIYQFPAIQIQPFSQSLNPTLVYDSIRKHCAKKFKLELASTLEKLHSELSDQIRISILRDLCLSLGFTLTPSSTPFPVKKTNNFVALVSINTTLPPEIVNLAEQADNQLQKHQIDRALEFSQKVIQYIYQTLCGSHPLLPSLYKKMSRIHFKVGDMDAAIAYAVYSISIFELMMGEDHFQTLEAYSLIGVYYYHRKSFGQAQAYLCKAASLMKSSFTSYYPDLLPTYLNLGALYQEAGRPSDALVSAAQTLQICQKVYGKVHTNTGICAAAFAAAYYKIPDLPHAIQYQEMAVQILRSQTHKETYFFDLESYVDFPSKIVLKKTKIPSNFPVLNTKQFDCFDQKQILQTNQANNLIRSDKQLLNNQKNIQLQSRLIEAQKVLNYYKSVLNSKRFSKRNSNAPGIGISNSTVPMLSLAEQFKERERQDLMFLMRKGRKIF